MDITINNEVLKKEHLTMGEFLVMLMGFYNVRYKDCFDSLVDKKIIYKNVFDKDDMVLSDNTRNLITNILMKSDKRMSNSNIDFTKLAKKLQDLYPTGCKSGTTYSWRDNTETIADKLRALVVVHHFSFTEEEAIKATKEYVSFFGEDKGNMQLLKYFILKTKKDGDIESMFMTIIENNR